MSTVTALRASARVVGSFTKSAPSLGGTASDLLDAIDSAGTAKWLDPAPVSNDCLEFYEIDLTSLNSGNPVTVVSMRMDFSWRHDKNSSTTGTWICNTAALDADDNLVRGIDDSRIWYNTTLAATYDYALGWTTRPTRYTTADGRNWSEFDRLGFTIESIWGNGTGEIRVYDVQVYVEWEPGNPGESDSVTATLTYPTGSPTIGGSVTPTWSYANTAGNPQTHWEIEVTATGVSPGIGSELYGTGKVAGESTRSHTVDATLDAATYDVSVRSWSTTSGGQVIRSKWDTETFIVPVWSDVEGEGTPSAPSSLVASWVPPAMSVYAYQEEPRSSGWRYWDAVEVQSSTDGGAYVDEGYGQETTSAFEELLASHDSDYVLICAEDIASGTEVWPVRHPAGVADGTFTTTGNASKVWDWPGDHYLALPGVDDNSAQALSVSAASSTQVDIAFDVELDDIIADQRILNWAGGHVDLIDSSEGVEVTIWDGTNNVTWSASSAELGVSLYSSRLQIWITVDLATDEAEFYVRDYCAPGLTVDTDQGWTLAHTDTTPSVASAGSRASGSGTATVGEDPAVTNPCSGRIFEVVAWQGASLTKELHFIPAGGVGCDQSNPDAGYAGWTDDLLYSWTLNQDHNSHTTPVAHIVTSGTYMTTMADSTDAAEFADAVVRAKFAAITASGGELTVIWAGRPDLATGAPTIRSAWSTENGGESMSLRLTSSGNISFRIDGATTGYSESGGTAVSNDQLVVAVVIAQGNAYVWDSVSNSLTTGVDISGAGALPTPGDFTLGARAGTLTQEDFGGTHSMVAIVQKALTEAEIEALQNPFLAGRRLFRRWLVSEQPAHNASLLYRVRGVNAERSRSSAWVPGPLTQTTSTGWWMIHTTTMAVWQPTVIAVEREDPETAVVIDQLPPVREAVVVTSGPQATRLTLTFRTMNKTERRTLEDFLGARGPWRLINSLGEEWVVRQSSGRTLNWIRALPTAADVGNLRDLYETQVSFVEVED